MIRIKVSTEIGDGELYSDGPRGVTRAPNAPWEVEWSISLPWCDGWYVGNVTQVIEHARKMILELQKEAPEGSKSDFDEPRFGPAVFLPVLPSEDKESQS